LLLAALREIPSAFASTYAEEADTSITMVAERLAASADGPVLGAFVDSELVGILGLRREHMEKLAHKAFIWGVYVAPSMRGRGVGGQLLKRALARASTMQGLLQINLGVNAANAAAIALYQAAGFTPFGLERGFMLIDGELHDEIHMVCMVTPTS
jgi:RimJ/RimL family protein N-acetyltransferase